MEKEQVGTKVSKEVLDAFKDFVLDKYGKLHGAYSREVERALSFYLSSESIKVKEMNPKPSTREVFKEVTDYFLKKKGHVPDEVPLKLLKEAISEVRGRGDGACKRTIRKWFKRFKEEGLIKTLG